MRTTPPSSSQSGMTLMEVVIAIGIVAVAIPLIFGVMTAASGSRRQAADETQAPFIAKSLMDDIQRGWRGEGFYFDNQIPAPTFGESGNEQIFGFSSDGEFVKKLTAEEDSTGISEPDLLYIAKVSGEAPDTSSFLQGEPVTPDTSLVTITIQSPAAAPPANRKTMTYQTLKGPAK